MFGKNYRNSLKLGIIFFKKAHKSLYVSLVAKKNERFGHKRSQVIYCIRQVIKRQSICCWFIIQYFQCVKLYKRIYV